MGVREIEGTQYSDVLTKLHMNKKIFTIVESAQSVVRREEQIPQINKTNPVNKYDADAPPTFEQIEAWLASWLSESLNRDAYEIDTRVPWSAYGMDSLRTVEMICALGTWLGQSISETLPWEFPTIEKLAGHLAMAGT